jgi:Lysophospholipase L1 and related esterases
MSCNDDKTYEPCSCGCGGNSDCTCDCNECAPVNCIEQAIRDALATLQEQLEALVKRAEDAAKASEDAAAASAASAAEAKDYRDAAELAATTATDALKTITDVAVSLEETAKKLQEIADELATAIAGIAVVTWYYTAVSEGQTTIPVPDDKNALDVQCIYIEGARQEPGRGFVFDKTTKTITLAEGIPMGMEISIILGMYSDNPTDFPHTLASNNGASLVGTTSGDTVQEVLNDINTDLAGLDRTVRSDLISSASGKGDELVRVKQPFSNSNPTTVHEKMRHIVTIQDGSTTGAEPDGVTDCTPSLLNLIATNCSVIRFPYIPGTANVYYFSAFDPDTVQNKILDVDPNVKLSVPTDWLAGKASAQYIGFTTDTRFVFRNLKTEYLASPYNNHTKAAKRTFLEEASFDRATTKAIIPSTDMFAQKIAWPNQDTWLADTFSSVNTLSASISASAGDDAFHMAFMDVTVGYEISSCILINSTPQLAAIVRSSGGFSGVFAQPTQTGASITQIYKEIGKTALTTTLDFPMLHDHPAYSPVNCEWKIRINSMNNYDILLNGFHLTTINAPGYIKDAGFGAYFNTGLSNPLVNVYQPVLTVNNRYTRNGFVTVKVFGDSISAPRVDCWPNFLKDELEFSEGLRNWRIINKAIPGDNTAGQLAIMQSEGVSDANIVVIAVGTNDGQGQTDLTAYKNNLTSMINICNAAGVTVILCKFGIWYTQTEAGSVRGQPSANAEKAFRYRNTVARVAAETGAKLVDLTAIEGPIAAYYINPNLYVNMVGAGDSFLHDNIHPTTTANCVIARAVARAIMGTLASTRTERSPGMLVVNAQNNWLINTGDRPARVSLSNNGMVSLGGIIFKSTGSVANGTLIATIPRNLAPIYTEQFMVYADTQGVNVQVTPLGEIFLYGATTATNFIGLSGLTWLRK